MSIMALARLDIVSIVVIIMCLHMERIVFNVDCNYIEVSAKVHENYSNIALSWT